MKMKYELKDIALKAMKEAGVEIVRTVTGKPGLQATLDSLISRISTGEAENRVDSKEVGREVESIVSLFRLKSLHPQRLAVDGVPGSGKTTLAYALAKELGMNALSLDHMDMESPLDFSVNKTIYEHHRLLRTQNIEWFDALIYIDEPVEISRNKVLLRKRGGYLTDIMDYDLLKRVGERAFSIADGEEYNVPESYLKIKIRPEGGYNANKNLVNELRTLDVNDKGLSKEQLLFLSLNLEPRSGFVAYINPNALTDDLLSGVVKGVFRAIGESVKR